MASYQKRDVRFTMSSLIDQKKAELAQRKQDAQKIKLFNSLWRHLKAVVYIVAELYLGYKPDLE
jgi:hypothetical protein